MSDVFGFGDIRPGTTARHETREDVDASEKVAEARGFVSRQAVPTIQKKAKSGSDGPVGQFNLRAAVTDVNEFIDWCGRERMSYREGFGILLELKRKAGL